LARKAIPIGPNFPVLIEGARIDLARTARSVSESRLSCSQLPIGSSQFQIPKVTPGLQTEN
jgi:hypothetical protein